MNTTFFVISNTRKRWFKHDSFPECTLDEAKSGCVWDEDQGKLSMFYEVTLNPGVWTLNERAALVDKTEGNIQFWTCSGGDYLEGWVS